MFKQTQKITTLKGVGEKTAAPFFAKGIETVNQLLSFLPISYISYEPSELIDGANVSISGIINSQVRDFSPRRNLTICNFTVTDGEQTYKIVAWNQRHLKFAYKQGDKVNLLAKYDGKRQQLTLKKIEKTELKKDAKTVIAAYSKLDKVSNLKINKIIMQAIADLDIDENSKQMLAELHKPSNEQNLQVAREQFKRLEFERYYQKIINMRGEERIDDNFKILADMNIVNQFIANLPYSLTAAQEKAVISGLESLALNRQMQTLVLGDVGCGKTIVSIIYALVAITNGVQVAFMLPTDILAKQIYNNICQLLPDYKTELLVSSVKPKNKKLIKSRLQMGSIDIIVGTHALIEDDVEFKNLGFVVIDEQHRFGVAQREALVNKGQYTNYCYLSATPIPRTLAHTLYGVVDVINIDQKPANRIPIDTRVYKRNQRKQMMAKIDSELEKGNQVFVLTPLAYEVEDLNLADSHTTFEKFKQYYENKYKVGMINGQLKAEHKDKIMSMFRNREYDLLVATTVIEVGVDIPGATTIAILNAERFGLATLHQLRGRVGRNDKQSYCLLLDQSNNEKSANRLAMMEQIDDGKRLAQIDYEMRGMGELTGVRQSGSEDFILFDLVADQQMATEVINQLSAM